MPPQTTTTTEGPRSTWDLLQSFGFQPDADVISDINPGLGYEFGGGFRLAASAVLSLQFEPVVLFTGTVFGPRRLATVEFELPRAIASAELCAAFLAYYLDKQAGESTRHFEPVVATPWLALGRQNAELLPWVQLQRANEEDQRRYAARPHCYVNKKFARPLLEALAEATIETGGVETAWFSFDGEVLKVRCGRRVFAAAGEGLAWDGEFGIVAASFAEVPRRLFGPRVLFELWKGVFRIGRQSHSLASSHPSEAERKVETQ
jgi:hypothetical protein